jgi:hypothetical protein
VHVRDGRGQLERAAVVVALDEPCADASEDALLLHRRDALDDGAPRFAWNERSSFRTSIGSERR